MKIKNHHDMRDHAKDAIKIFIKIYRLGRLGCTATLHKLVNSPHFKFADGTIRTPCQNASDRGPEARAAIWKVGMCYIAWYIPPWLYSTCPLLYSKRRYNTLCYITCYISKAIYPNGHVIYLCYITCYIVKVVYTMSYIKLAPAREEVRRLLRPQPLVVRVRRRRLTDSAGRPGNARWLVYPRPPPAALSRAASKPELVSSTLPPLSH